MILRYGNYILDVDAAATSAFYARHADTEDCDCPGCRNYRAWTASVDCTLREALVPLGLRPEQVAEIYVNCRNDDGTLFYGGFFHICGKILQSGIVWTEITERSRTMGAESFVELVPGFDIYFEEEVHLLEKDFPTPVIQMEFYTNIPWVLPEPCDY